MTELPTVLLTSVRNTFPGFPGLISMDPVQGLVGGAYPMSSGCYCDCGRRASLNLGTITYDFSIPPDFTFTGSASPIDAWAFYDTYSRFPNYYDSDLAEGNYAAWLTFTPETDGCLPSVVVRFGMPTTFDPDDFLGPSKIEVSAAGLGQLWTAYDNGAFVQVEDLSHQRAGVVIGSPVGSYGSISTPGDGQFLVVPDLAFYYQWRDWP